MSSVQMAGTVFVIGWIMVNVVQFFGKNKCRDNLLLVAFYTIAFLDLTAHFLIAALYTYSMSLGQTEKEKWENSDGEFLER